MIKYPGERLIFSEVRSLCQLNSIMSVKKYSPEHLLCDIFQYVAKIIAKDRAAKAIGKMNGIISIVLYKNIPFKACSTAHIARWEPDGIIILEFLGFPDRILL